MMAPSRAYDGLAALTSTYAAEWMFTAARTRPVRIAPRIALATKALDTVAPRRLNAAIRRQTLRSNR
jgi:hypothetical protein